MKRHKLGISFFCFILAITIGTNGIFIKAVERQTERIEVTYLPGEWVDCSQPINKNFICIQIYYKDGTVIQKQGVGTIYPYTLTPGCLSRIQVEYEGMTGEFFVWGIEESNHSAEPSQKNPQTSAIPENNATTGASVKATAIPAPVSLKSYYELVSSQKKIVLTKKAVNTYKVYEKRNLVFTLGTNNMKKIEYQFVKKGKKKTQKWKIMRNNQVVLRNQGYYVLYLRFTTMAGKKIIKHTNGFVLDKSKPVIRGVKNKKTYSKKVTITYADSLSGIRKATINGEKLKKNTTIRKNGTYQVEVTDKAKNKKSLQFTVNIPTPTPKPTIPPTATPLPEPAQIPYIPVTEVTAVSSLSVEKGKTKRISYQVFPSNATNSKVTFTSTNRNIVTVSTDGTIKGKAPGVASVVIRSQSNSTQYATCVIYVK